MPNEVSVHVQEYGFGGSFFEDEFFDTDDDEEEDNIKPMMKPEWGGTVSEMYANSYYLSERRPENSSHWLLCKLPDWLRVNTVVAGLKTALCSGFQGNITNHRQNSVVRSVIKNGKVLLFQRMCTKAQSLLFFRERRLLLKLKLQIRRNSVIETSWRSTHSNFYCVMVVFVVFSQGLRFYFSKHVFTAFRL